MEAEKAINQIVAARVRNASENTQKAVFEWLEKGYPYNPILIRLVFFIFFLIQKKGYSISI